MKSIDELLIAWRDGSITPEESKELERLLAEPGGRESLFDDFMMTATITEALRIDARSPEVQRDQQRSTSWWRRARIPVAAAAVVLLLAGVAIYFRFTTRAPRGFEIVAGSALVDQKEDGPIREKSNV